jgi:hypothetical protein
MEAVRVSETSVYFNETTRRYIRKGYDLHIHRHENLKYYRQLLIADYQLYEL